MQREDFVPRQQSMMNKGHPVGVWDGQVMKHLKYHIGGEGREMKRSPIATVLDVMMQREREREASHHK